MFLGSFTLKDVGVCFLKRKKKGGGGERNEAET